MQKKNILVVEDDLNLGFLLSEFLEEEGYQVKLCRDGNSGYQALQRRNFDLCFESQTVMVSGGICTATFAIKFSL